MVELTEAEAAVYDRQLRVWGIEVQKRLNAARILIAGCAGLAAEVAKNIVLAGVGSLALMDDTACSAVDAGNFLVPADADPKSSVAEASVATLQEMNPLVKVSLQQGAVSTQDLTFVQAYQVVLLVDQSLESQQLWDEACTKHGTAFYSAAAQGTCAYFFANLQLHTFAPLQDLHRCRKKLQLCMQEKAGEDTSAVQPQQIQYTSLSSALQSSWATVDHRRSHKMICILQACAEVEKKTHQAVESKDMAHVKEILQRRLAQIQPSKLQIADSLIEEFVTGGCFPPINAICGGLLANEMLKAVSKKGDPINNFLFYDLASGAAVQQRHG